MNRITEILIERDGMTREEAKSEISRVRDDMMSALEDGDMFLAEDIFLDDLGLELDYLIDMLA